MLAQFARQERRHLHSILDRLSVRGAICESRAGFRASDVAPPQPVEEPPPPEPLSGPVPAMLAELIRRAQAHAQDDAPAKAADLLRTAARRVTLPHVSQDLLALSDLFAANDGPYRNLDLPRGAA